MTDPSDPHTPSRAARTGVADLSGALHDVSNALTVLLGWVSEARAPEATPEAVAYALTIIEQRARIARDLARHAIGAPRIDEQRELGAILDEVVAALQVEAQRVGARIVVRGGDASAKVAGSLDLSQVLTNLLLNGLAYTPSGALVHVTVTIDDAKCAVLVADEGPGVAPERRERIFQGDSLRPGGTGVGLQHSRALARAWEGDVELVVHEGNGARFRVTWPRIDAVPRPPVSTSRVSDLSGLRVLVVEDDEAVRQLLEAGLEARGAEVTVATTASELTAVLARATFDAALVDLSPIGDDAAGAIAALRERCPDVKVVVITGNADALPDAVQAESVELVRKPFEIREILAVLAAPSPKKKRA